MTDRVECKLKAKELLRGRWENAVGACLLFFVSTFLLSFLLSPIPIFGWIIITLISSFLTGKDEGLRKLTSWFLSCFKCADDAVRSESKRFAYNLN